LKRYGIPLDPYAAHEVISSERESTKDELRRLALIDEDGSPTWSLKKSFFWQQRFPFHQEIRIEHRYRPIVGGTVYTSLGASKQSDAQLAFNEKFCVDEEFVREVKIKTKMDSVTEYYSTSFSVNWIEYVLTTGANWSGPIRKFRLVVDKGREDNLVSFCGEGIRKVGATLFEFAATNFVPKKDLFILILLPLKPPNTDSDSPTRSLGALSCDELWLRRNSIFKAAGYCFKAPRAISKFGNSGCSFDHVDHVPLSSADRILVAQISSLEQSKGCVR
jgi:hypothetical protein